MWGFFFSHPDGWLAVTITNPGTPGEIFGKSFGSGSAESRTQRWLEAGNPGAFAGAAPSNESVDGLFLAAVPAMPAELRRLIDLPADDRQW